MHIVLRHVKATIDTVDKTPESSFGAGEVEFDESEFTQVVSRRRKKKVKTEPQTNVNDKSSNNKSEAKKVNVSLFGALK